MASVETLQGKLESMARAQADAEAKRLVALLPGFPDIQVWANRDKIKIERGPLIEGLIDAMRETLYAGYLAEATNRLLNAVDAIEEVRSAAVPAQAAAKAHS